MTNPVQDEAVSDGFPPQGRDVSLPPSRGYYAKAVGLCLLVPLGAYLAMLPVFRDHLLAYFDASEWAFAAILGVGPFTSILSAMAGGWWQERFGPVSALRASLLGMAPGLAVMAAAGNRWGLFLAGFAASSFFVMPLTVSVGVLLTRLFPDNRRKALLFSLVVTGLGAMVAPVGIEILLASLPFAWALHLPFAVLAVVMGTAGLSRWRWCPGPPAGGGSSSSSRWTPLGFRLPVAAWLLVLLMAAHSTADTLAAGWLPRSLGALEAGGAWARIKPGAVLSFMGLIYLATRLSLLFLPERFGARAFLVLPGLLGGATLLAGTLAGGYGALATGYCLGAFCWSWEYPAFWGHLAADERRFGRAYAMSLALSNLISLSVVAALGALMARRPDMLSRVMAFPAGLFMLIGLAGGVYWLLHGKKAHAAGAAG